MSGPRPAAASRSTCSCVTVDTVYRTWHTAGRGTEQLGYSFALVDLLPYGRQEVWQDSPDGWPQGPTYSRWAGSQDVAAAYGPDA